MDVRITIYEVRFENKSSIEFSNRTSYLVNRTSLKTQPKWMYELRFTKYDLKANQQLSFPKSYIVPCKSYLS